jgi:hypothetical protein
MNQKNRFKRPEINNPHETVNIMKLSRIAILLAFSFIGTQAFAEESQARTPAPKTPVETYSYGSNLDIKKVIAVSDVPNECGPVSAQMTYEDSRGQRHVLQYQVMGNGCTNG